MVELSIGFTDESEKARQARNIDLTIVIPTRNEAGSISNCINAVIIALEHRIQYEILILDDNSSDGTKEMVSKLSTQNPSVKLVNRVPPYGFGNSISDGIQRAKGNVVVIMMGDLSDDPKFLLSMKEKIGSGCDVVNGSRFIKGSKIYSYPILKYISNRLFNIAVMVGLLTPTTDTSTNFKAFRTAKAQKINLTSNGFEIGAELMLRMLISGAKICEIPVTWSDRTSGQAKFKLHHTFINYFLLFLKMLKLAYLKR